MKSRGYARLILKPSFGNGYAAAVRVLRVHDNLDRNVCCAVEIKAISHRRVAGLRILGLDAFHRRADGHRVGVVRVNNLPGQQITLAWLFDGIGRHGYILIAIVRYVDRGRLRGCPGNGHQ